MFAGAPMYYPPQARGFMGYGGPGPMGMQVHSSSLSFPRVAVMLTVCVW